MNVKNAVIASAVASMFLTGAALAKGKSDKKMADKVKCSGINSCGGHGACKSASNECAGKNSCKGKGWVEAKSEKDCKDQGGTVVAMEEKK